METIKSVRKELGITKKAMARRMNVSRPTYDKYESNPGKMRVWRAKQLASILGITLEDILRISEDMEKSRSS